MRCGAPSDVRGVAGGAANHASAANSRPYSADASEHHRRAEDPVDHEAADQHTSVAGDGVQLAVPHLREDRMHHQQQSEGDRQADVGDLDRVECVAEAQVQGAAAATPISTVGGRRGR
jgi:hypothetical protein